MCPDKLKAIIIVLLLYATTAELLANLKTDLAFFQLVFSI